ncbi:MAG: 30S ribosomal protein S12 methylthiotransferase RimO [Rikenellaceae bacterium]|jgi:ribosomal protein S12 methylthiotransferase|nr:30S ribosomal protein S12 methylthiotransferase RimO [Rikenellaceae bacterium]
MKVNIVTLGCAKNTVDSEHLAAQLAAGGFEIAYDGDTDAARTVVVNTCGFIGDAKEESVNTILQFADAKEQGLIDRLYVFGCLSQRYAAELPAEIPEVDAFFGVDDLSQLTIALGAKYDPALQSARELSTPRHYAYLKISEGCDRSCSYCIIPQIRGKHRSVPEEELLAEARLLAAKGVKELIVIAQDTTYYGLDLYKERRLAPLLRKLCTVEGIEWVRLHYAYPAGFPGDVIDAIRDEPKICKYIDIPLQHIAEGQLRSMRRGSTGADTRALIEKLRREIPGIAIRTTMIVGYPGETAKDFEELVEFIKRARFERLGVFPYSEEEDTISARTLKDDVPQAEKERRAEYLITVQSGITLEENLARLGTTQRVIVDRREGDYWVCRTQYDSPEVDQEVFIPADNTLKPGDFCDVTIEKAGHYELYGHRSRK